MGKVKQQLIDAQEQWFEDMPDLMGQALADAEREFLEAEEVFLFDPAKHSTEWVPPRSGDLAVSLRNHARHGVDNVNEADDMPLWIQLELDLWEGQHGINEASYWDVAGRGTCEVRN